MIKIDKGIEIPAKRTIGRKPKYPWRDMEIGDSFFVAGKNTLQFNGQITVAKHSTGFKFISRTIDGGVRVWRVE